jgi:hypothetical protein
LDDAQRVHKLGLTKKEGEILETSKQCTVLINNYFNSTFGIPHESFSSNLSLEAIDLSKKSFISQNVGKKLSFGFGFGATTQKENLEENSMEITENQVEEEVAKICHDFNSSDYTSNLQVHKMTQQAFAKAKKCKAKVLRMLRSKFINQYDVKMNSLLKVVKFVTAYVEIPIPGVKSGPDTPVLENFRILDIETKAVLLHDVKRDRLHTIPIKSYADKMPTDFKLSYFKNKDTRFAKISGGKTCFNVGETFPKSINQQGYKILKFSNFGKYSQLNDKMKSLLKGNSVDVHDTPYAFHHMEYCKKYLTWDSPQKLNEYIKLPFVCYEASG